MEIEFTSRVVNTCLYMLEFSEVKLIVWFVAVALLLFLYVLFKWLLWLLSLLQNFLVTVNPLNPEVS